MRQEIEKRYRASLSTQVPVGVEELKLKEAFATVPFVVGKLEGGRTKTVILGGIFSLREIHLLANHLRSHHNLQIKEVIALQEEKTKVTVAKTETPRKRRDNNGQTAKDRHVKMKF